MSPTNKAGAVLGLLVAWIANHPDVPLASAQEAATSDVLSARALMRHVTYLAAPALDGRAAGSAGETLAASYVAAQLERFGLTAHERSFRILGGESVNVEAMVEGNAPGVVVIGAHIDHLGTRGGVPYPGAEDNASGVAVVLELARALSQRRAQLRRSILFAFFGAEEVGMLGSLQFVLAPSVPLREIVAMVNVDMIGRPLVDQAALSPLKPVLGIDDHWSVGMVGPRDRPALQELGIRACAEEGIWVATPEDLPGPLAAAARRQVEGRGDSATFELAGVPALFFGSGESDDYHSPRDTPERLRPEIMERRARALLRVALRLSAAPASTFDVGAHDLPARAHASSYLPIGLGSGVSFHAAGAGAYVGGEASLVRLDHGSLVWTGVYVDSAYDLATKTTRLGGGPELGLGPLGLDGGLVLEPWSNPLRAGAALRAILTAGYVSLTGRVARVWAAGSVDSWGEVGVLLKFPLLLERSGEPPHPAAKSPHRTASALSK